MYILKFGNDFVLQIPEEFIKKFNLVEGSELDVNIQEDNLIIKVISKDLECEPYDEDELKLWDNTLLDGLEDDPY
jgi:antitoxin component of MazEF toxin-antitoxin module